LKHGTAGEGLAVVGDALDWADATGTHLWDSELHRLKGELLLALDPSTLPSAKIAFGKAIDLARRQSAKSWELSAATSLARLWRDQGKRQQANDLLAPVYGWFTEGFDTPVLQDAKALLDQLT
ncbi:MAG TPA: adenylate cyclase, partial [Candidatus Angelobacter sp.]|nr:adenylate cyclase [Candidatus Angelobacter sp.]